MRKNMYWYKRPDGQLPGWRDTRDVCVQCDHSRYWLLIVSMTASRSSLLSLHELNNSAKECVTLVAKGALSRHV